MLNCRNRWYSCDTRGNIRWRLDVATIVYCLRRGRLTDAIVRYSGFAQPAGTNDNVFSDRSFFVCLGLLTD